MVRVGEESSIAYFTFGRWGTLIFQKKNRSIFVAFCTTIISVAVVERVSANPAAGNIKGNKMFI